MTEAEINALLDLKRMRERCAAAALAEARKMEQRAAAAQARADEAVRSFAAYRRACEDELYGKLRESVFPLRELLRVSAILNELSARAHQLRRRAALAAKDHDARRAAATAAARRRGLALREAETLSELAETLRQTARTNEERTLEAELDDIVSLRFGLAESLG